MIHGRGNHTRKWVSCEYEGGTHCKIVKKRGKDLTTKVTKRHKEHKEDLLLFTLIG
jgi:hypothetical protein